MGGNEWGSSFLQPSATASCSSAALHQSYGTSCKLLPSNTASKFKSPIFQQHCHSRPPTCTRTTFRTTQDAVILARSPKYHTLCHLFALFFQTVLRGDAIIPLFLVMSHIARSPTLAEVTNNYCRP